MTLTADSINEMAARIAARVEPTVELGVTGRRGLWYVTELVIDRDDEAHLIGGWSSKVVAVNAMRRSADAWTQDGYRVDLK